MSESGDVRNLRRIVAILRVTLGVIILVAWWDNFQKGVYSAQGITGLLNGIFSAGGGSVLGYRGIINSTVLQFSGPFAAFQMVAELLMGLGLLLGLFTPLLGLGATFFFLNLFLAYFGGSEQIWPYVLLTVSALVVALTRSGRAYGIDVRLAKQKGKPPFPFLW